MISKLVTYLYNIVIHNVKQKKAKLTQVRFESNHLIQDFCFKNFTGYCVRVVIPRLFYYIKQSRANSLQIVWQSTEKIKENSFKPAKSNFVWETLT